MWPRHSQTIEPDSRPDAGLSSFSAAGPVGLVFTVATLLIFLVGIQPARWFLLASVALVLISLVILRYTRRH